MKSTGLQLGVLVTGGGGAGVGDAVPMPPQGSIPVSWFEMLDHGWKDLLVLGHSWHVAFQWAFAGDPFSRLFTVGLIAFLGIRFFQALVAEWKSVDPQVKRK